MTPLFPFLGFKTLTDEDVEMYDLDPDYEYKGFVFEWLGLCILWYAKGTLKESDAYRGM